MPKTMRTSSKSPNPKPISRSSNGRSPSRARGRCGSRCRPAASATATRSPRRGYSPGSSTRACPAMRWSGVIDAVGPGVPRLGAGPAVGVGWNGGYCGYCDPCRRGRFLRLPDRGADHRHHLRRRLRRVHDRPRRRVARDARRTAARRRGPADVRRPDHVQRAAQQRRPAGRRRRRAGAGRARPPGRPVRGEDGLPHGRASPAARTRSRSPGSWARRSTSTARPRTRRRSCTKLGGAKVILATVTSGEAMSAAHGRPGRQRHADGPRGRRVDARCPPCSCSSGCRSVKGWYSGTSIDSQDTLAFSVQCRRPVDERGLPAGPGRRGLRPHDERQGAVPGRADAVRVSRPRADRPRRSPAPTRRGSNRRACPASYVDSRKSISARPGRPPPASRRTGTRIPTARIEPPPFRPDRCVPQPRRLGRACTSRTTAS